MYSKLPYYDNSYVCMGQCVNIHSDMHWLIYRLRQFNEHTAIPIGPLFSVLLVKYKNIFASQYLRWIPVTTTSNYGNSLLIIQYLMNYLIMLRMNNGMIILHNSVGIISWWMLWWISIILGKCIPLSIKCKIGEQVFRVAKRRKCIRSHVFW